MVKVRRAGAMSNNVLRHCGWRSVETIAQEHEIPSVTIIRAVHRDTNNELQSVELLCSMDVRLCSSNGVTRQVFCPR